MKKGILYGVGVGPGDPEMMTLKAVRLINENQYIGVPRSMKEFAVVYNIAKQVVPNLNQKTFLECDIPMTKDKGVLNTAYSYAVTKITRVLDAGENVIFLNLGDPTIYGTYVYIHQRILALGYQAEIVNGIPSFCAAASRMKDSLAERSEMIHIVPSSYDIDDAMKMPGTKILMKAGSELALVREKLMSLDVDVFMIENCCMDKERMFFSAEEIDENAGYYTLLIVKDKK